jgi:UDP-N-acetylmuramate--alanine ligase
MKKTHFVGIGGHGMSALAQIHAMSGEEITGSDRLYDKKIDCPIWQKMRDLNISFFPQDGSGISENTGRVVLSTAIEEDNPDLKKAKELNLEIVHRAELLATHIEKSKTIAVSGTSGKSTVTAMIYEIMEKAGMSPGLITGGSSLYLQENGLIGNAINGKSEYLVIEADESDGSLVKYKPYLGMVLNVTKDHKEISELKEIFSKFKTHCQKFIVCNEDDNLNHLKDGSVTFGLKSGDVVPVDIELGPTSCRFKIDGVSFVLPVSGMHNVSNGVAAVSACKELGISLEKCASGLHDFRGVYRRFVSVGKHKDIEVIDDFAHNPAKISASLSAAKLRGKRLLVFFQPHGYFPTKLMKNDYIETFSTLGKDDILWMPEIYYSGGTVDRSISSNDIVSVVREKGINANFEPDRKKIAEQISKHAKAHDVVLVLGARDLTLPEFAKDIFNMIVSLQKSVAGK